MLLEKRDPKSYRFWLSPHDKKPHRGALAEFQRRCRKSAGGKGLAPDSQDERRENQDAESAVLP